MVREAVTRYGFRGLKVHRYDAPISREICEAARAYRLPVLYDVMGEVAPIEMIATEYPDVSFIIPHLGSFADDWRAQLALIDHLERHANVFADSSGVRRWDLLAQAVARAGPNKLIFGSDGPWLHPGIELEKVLALDLTPSELAAVTGRTIQRLMTRVRALPGQGHARVRGSNTEGSTGRWVGVPDARGSMPEPVDPWVMSEVDGAAWGGL